MSSFGKNAETCFSTDVSPLYQRNRRKSDDALAYLKSLQPIMKRAGMKKKLTDKFGVECGKSIVLPSKEDLIQGSRVLVLVCKDCTNFKLYCTQKNAKTNAKSGYAGDGFTCDLSKSRLDHFSLVDGIEHPCQSRGHTSTMVRSSTVWQIRTFIMHNFI